MQTVKPSYEERHKVAEEIYWDMYKDAYGLRPRGVDTSNWTLNQFDAEFARLEEIIHENYLQEQAEDLKAITTLENTICDRLANEPNLTRESIIDELHAKHHTDGDDQMLCYILHLPYGYFRK